MGLSNTTWTPPSGPATPTGQPGYSLAPQTPYEVALLFHAVVPLLQQELLGDRARLALENLLTACAEAVAAQLSEERACS